MERSTGRNGHGAYPFACLGIEKNRRVLCKGTGFEVVNRFGTQALFISDGKYHHHIGLNTWNGIGDFDIKTRNPLQE